MTVIHNCYKFKLTNRKNVFIHWSSIRDFCFRKYVLALPTMFHTVDLSSCPASFLMHRNNILAGFGASSYKYNSKKSKLLLLNHMGWFLPLSVSHRSSNIVAFKSDIDLWCLALLFKKLLIHNVYELYIYICVYVWMIYTLLAM